MNGKNQKTGAPQALSPDDIAMLRQAANAQRQLAQLGAINPASDEVIADVAKDVAKREVVMPPQRTAKPSPLVLTPKQHTATTTDYENFIRIDGLPSKGKFYSEPVLGQPLKVQDLIQIQGMDETNVAERFDQIFTRRLRGVNPQEILLCDELFLSFWLRANSFPGYHFPNLPYMCSHCQYEVKEREADFDFLNLGFVVANLESCVSAFGAKSSVEIKMQSGKSVSLYLRRRGHVTMAHEYIKETYTSKDIELDEDTENLIYMASVLDFGGDVDLKETLGKLEQLDAMDFLQLVKELNKYSLVDEATVHYKCPNCQGLTPNVGYPFRPEIFFPTD